MLELVSTSGVKDVLGSGLIVMGELLHSIVPVVVTQSSTCVSRRTPSIVNCYPKDFRKSLVEIDEYFQDVTYSAKVVPNTLECAGHRIQGRLPQFIGKSNIMMQ